MAAALVAGRYQLAELIGRGGFGSVHAAVDTQSNRRVALKTLHAPQDHGTRARFSREAEICARLQCPSTVRLLDHGEHEGTPFIVYELLEGESLASALERGPLPEGRALAITRAVLTSLSEAHRAGVVHRDVKPANVFLTRDGQSKLLDFGVAASLTPSTGRNLTATGEIVGTPPYLAPEQLMSGVLSPATDLYAVALMLAEMLNGKRVFDGPPLAVMAKKARLAAPPFDSALLLSRFGNTLLAATAKEPSARFQSAEMMLGALAGTGSRTRSGYRIPIAIGAVVLLLAGGSALAYQLSRPKAGRRAEDGKRERVAKYCPGIDGVALPALGKRYPEWKIVMTSFQTTHHEVVFGKGEKVVGYVKAYNDARGAKALRTALETDGAHLQRDANVDVLIGDRGFWHVNMPEAEATDLIGDFCP